MKKKHYLQGREKFFSLQKKIWLIMKLTLLLTIICVLQATAAISQSTVEKVHIKNVPLEQFFSIIEQQTSVKFLYRYENIEGKVVSVNMENVSVDQLLDATLPKNGLGYSKMKNHLIVISPARQNWTITGSVVDEKGAPLVGVTIVIKGTMKGTTTDVNGNYSLVVPNDQTVLQFSFIGFVTQEVTVGEKSIVNITLQEDTRAIDEVVVTALGIEKAKKTLTYATQQVDMESVSTVRDPSLATSLMGKIAGVSISTSSGNNGVGASSRIIIRGNRSLSSGNQPIIIVDGVPYNNSKGVSPASDDDREVDSFDGLSNINPDDIESMNILKGPSAAALYGSSALNGVIIITTKKAKTGQQRLEFNSITTVDIPYMYPHFQNKYGQGTGGSFNAEEETYSWGPEMNGQMLTDWTGESQAFSPQPNNVKDLFENSYNVTNSLAYSIGHKNATCYVSYSNTTAKGLLATDKLSRHNFNLRLTSEILPKLQGDFKMTFFNQSMASRSATGDDYFNPMENFIRMPRSLRTKDLEQFEYYNDEGERKQSIWVDGGSVVLNNPYWSMYRRVAPTNRSRVTAFSSLKYEFTPWLSLQGRISLDKINDDGEEKIYWDALAINDGEGNYYTAFQKIQNLTADFMLNFHKSINDEFDLTAMFGGEIKDNKVRAMSSNTNGLSVENKFALDYGKSNETTDSETHIQTQSFYGTAQIAYKNMLFLDGTARNDWDSTLPSPYDYFYPSVGLSGIISDIFNLPKVISFAKIRGSYAEVGKGASFSNIFQTYSRDASGPVGQIYPSSTKVAENLRPERTKSWEFGGEVKLWGNRLDIDFTWYKSNTINQLISVTTPATSGYSQSYINCGDIQNKGIELMISGTPIERADFSWDTHLTFSRNVNEVKELYDGVDKYSLGDANLALATRYVIVGRPYGEIYGRAFERNDEGNIIVGSGGIPKITDDEDYYLGNFNYDWQGGITNTFYYKKWFLSFLIDINYGGVRQSGTEAMLMETGGSTATLYGRDGFIFDGVTEDGAVNTVEITAEDYGTAVGGRNTDNIPVDLYNHDATNSRLREFSLGYTFPMRNTDLIKSIKISATGRNLFFIYNGCDWFDPDVTYNTSANGQGAENAFMPGTRTLGFNLKVSF